MCLEDKNYQVRLRSVNSAGAQAMVNTRDTTFEQAPMESEAPITIVVVPNYLAKVSPIVMSNPIQQPLRKIRTRQTVHRRATLLSHVLGRAGIAASSDKAVVIIN
jgi:hypothetical protein